jgi:hypothetical protein
MSETQNIVPPRPLVEALQLYVAAESAAIDGEWEHFTESHQLLVNTVTHLQNRTQVVESGIEASSKGIEEFLKELQSKSEEVECTLSVLESVAASLEEYSKTLERAFP